MIRVAHLSDLHFGPRFNVDTWKAVRAAIINEVKPNVIVVSGDFVDHPSPVHLLAAKCELEDLRKAAHAQLVAVPGNHDVFEYGIGAGQSRTGWWERIFNQDTSKAEEELKKQFGTSPSFEAQFRDQPSLRRSLSDRLRWLYTDQPKADFTQYIPPPTPPGSCVSVFDELPILFVSLDSNPSGHGADLATGIVSEAQLVQLREHLSQVERNYLARIAVVHHHVLPIAFAEAPQGRLEATMVLRNAGTLLHILAEYRFDLVLHGHWHKPQFARIQINPDDFDAYPMAVAAAGSAALETASSTGNCFNVVTIDDNGLIDVQAVFYGAGQAPNLNLARTFSEPKGSVALRGFARAKEHHGLVCKRREQSYTITENGDLRSEHKVVDLQLLTNFKGSMPYTRRPLVFTLPPHGRFVDRTLTVDEETKKRGGEIVRELPPAPPAAAASAQTVLHYSLILPDGGLQRGHGKTSFTLSHASANAMTMTHWEASQRADHAASKSGNQKNRKEHWDEEWVGIRIAYPLERLILRLTLPESLERIKPYVRCMRHERFPDYDVTKLGDVDFSTNGLQPDVKFQGEAESRFYYDPESRTWELNLERPMAGYQYELRWRLPAGMPPDSHLEGETRGFQQELLKLSKSLSRKFLSPRNLL